LAHIVEALAPHGEASVTADQMRPLIEAMHSYAFPNHIYLADAAMALSSRLAPGENFKAVSISLEAMEDGVSVVDAEYSAKIVAATTAGFTAAEAEAAAQQAVEAMGATENSFAQVGLSRAIVALSERLDATTGEIYVDRAAQIVLKNMQSEFPQEWLEDALESLAPKLKPATRKAAAEQVLKKIEGTQDSYQLTPLSQKLVAVMQQLDAGDSAPIAAAALQALIQVDGGHLSGWQTNPEQNAAQFLAARLTPAETAEVAPIALGIMSASPGGENWSGMCDLMAALAVQMDSSQSAAALRTLVDVLIQNDEWEAIRPLSAPLDSLATRLHGEDAAEIAKLLLEECQATTYVDVRMILSGTLASLAKTQDGAAWLEQIASLAGDSAATMESTEDPIVLSFAASGLANLASCLGPDQANPLARKAAAKLESALADPMDVGQIERMAGALGRLMPFLPTGDASAAAQTGVTALGKTNVVDWNIVTGFLNRLDPADPNSAEVFKQTISRQRRYQQHELISPMARYVSQVEQDRAFEVAEVLLQSTHSSQDQAALVEVLILQVEPAEVKDAIVTTGGDPYEYEFGPLGAPFTFLPSSLRQSGRSEIPGRFKVEQLLALMKAPTCQRSTRQVLLRQLSRQCDEQFTTIDDFMEWAGARQAHLDLKSPPKRAQLLARRAN
jgi:hypothetical protein